MSNPTIEEVGQEFPDGCCQSCGEPLNNADGELCFKCIIKKANV